MFRYNTLLWYCRFEAYDIGHFSVSFIRQISRYHRIIVRIYSNGDVTIRAANFSITIGNNEIKNEHHLYQIIKGVINKLK